MENPAGHGPEYDVISKALDHRWLTDSTPGSVQALAVFAALHAQLPAEYKAEKVSKEAEDAVAKEIDDYIARLKGGNRGRSLPAILLDKLKTLGVLEGGS